MKSVLAFFHRRRLATSVLLVSVAAICIGIPLCDLLNYPPYQFALTMPQTWQGAIEAAALACLLVWAQRISRPIVYIFVVLLLSEFFLRRHNVDVSALIDLVYFELLIALGHRLDRPHADRSPEPLDYIRWFVLGVCTWSACAWILSALGAGSIKDLRTLTVILGIVAATRKSQPAVVFAFRQTLAMPRNERTIVTLMFTWLLVLLAKTGVAMNFDALWYSLRSQYVLVGEGSAFASNGLVSSVYYFPKFYELLLVPLSGLGSSSVVADMSVFVWALFGVICYEILRALEVTSTRTRLILTFACTSLPAISNSAIDAKPDLFSALLVMCAWLFATRFLQTRARDAALWAIACGLLATQAKLVSIPFVGMLTLATLWFLFARRNAPIATAPRTQEFSRGVLVFTLSLVVSAFVTARTFVLTGMPTIGPDALVHVWQAIGFHFKFPTGTMAWMGAPDWYGAPLLAYDELFRPTEVGHFLTYWTGNIFLWAILVGAILPTATATGSAKFNAGSRIGLALVATLFVLLFGISYGVRGGDGNYFMAGFATVTLLALTWSARRSGFNSRAFFATIGAFVIFQLCFAFVSADWMTGTREFDFRIGRHFHSYRTENRKLLASQGLEAIDEFLRHLHKPARVVGCMDDNLDMRLDARAESVQQIAYTRLDFFRTSSSFLQFLRDDKIDYVIVPHPDNKDAYCYDVREAQDAFKELAQNPHVSRIDDKQYVMYDLTEWRKDREAGPSAE